MASRLVFRRLAWLVGLLTLLASAGIGATPAGAILLRLPSGRAISYMPLRGAAVPRAAIRAGRIGFDNAFHNLDYNGGPVMPSNTNWAIYWDPSGGTSFPSDYRSGLDQYFTDLAHDSGGSQNVDSVATQYNDSSGNTAAYNSRFGGSFIDSDPYPSSGCPSGSRICLTDAQLQNEIDAFAAAHGIPAGTLTNEVFLFTPDTVETCTDSSGDVCSANALDAPDNPVFCAYHSRTAGGYIYSNDPYAVYPDVWGCDDGHHPNGTSDGALEGGVSHEHNESITDPYGNAPAWIDYEDQNTEGEDGDKCGYALLGPGAFGASLGTAPDGSPYNQVINGHYYWYQMEWSNQGHTCLQHLAFSGARPAATFAYCAASSTAPFDATGSASGPGVEYDWQWNDHTNGGLASETSSPTTTHVFPAAGFTTTVALTVFAPDGTSTGTARSVTVGSDCPFAGFTTTSGRPGQPVGFDSAPSTSSHGPITTYAWTFGDGSSATGPAPSHTYARAGNYLVTLKVVDAFGVMGSGARMISVTAPVVMPPPPRCIVPNVKGKSRTTAVALLRRAHCSVGKVKAPRKPRRRAGRHRKWVLVVSRESPGARTSLAAGSGVSLTMAWEAVRR